MNVLTTPAIYALEITPACNNRCPGCSNVYATRRSDPALMSAQQWRRLLAPFVREAVRIRLTGGEPTLHPQFLQILDEVASHDAWVTVFTNGRWHNPEQLVRHVQKQSRVSGLLISLHGATADSHEAFSGVPGSFEETVANIRLAIDHGITVSLSTVITRHTWNEIDAVVELGRELGVDHVAVNRYIGAPLPEIEPTQGQVASAVSRIQDLVEDGAAIAYGVGVPQCFALNNSGGCLAGVAYIAIDPSGNVRPCSHSPTIIGSLHSSSMQELWHGSAMDRWRGLMPSACLSCAAYAVCHGGCRAIQELRSDHRDPLCDVPLESFSQPRRMHDLPREGRPRALVRIRPESFGYVLLGEGHAIPVSGEAREVVEACDGHTTFAQLNERFGQVGLDLLGDLWELGLLQV